MRYYFVVRKARASDARASGVQFKDKENGI